MTIWAEGRRAFTQPAVALAKVLGAEFEAVSRPHVYRGYAINPRHVICVERPHMEALIIELADWVGAYHRKKKPGTFDDSPCVIKLQFSSQEDYPATYRMFRYIGRDTKLLERMVDTTQNKDCQRVLWMGRLASGRQKWLTWNPNFKPLLHGLPDRLSVEEYYRFAGRFRFGLSLPGGHGQSLCHREVEYFALGVVPVMPSPICLCAPPLVPFVNYIPTLDFHPEMLRNDSLYHSIAEANKQLFLNFYTNDAWAAGAAQIFVPFL